MKNEAGFIKQERELEDKLKGWLFEGKIYHSGKAQEKFQKAKIGTSQQQWDKRQNYRWQDVSDHYRIICTSPILINEKFNERITLRKTQCIWKCTNNDHGINWKNCQIIPEKATKPKKLFYLRGMANSLKLVKNITNLLTFRLFLSIKK